MKANTKQEGRRAGTGGSWSLGLMLGNVTFLAKRRPRRISAAKWSRRARLGGKGTQEGPAERTTSAGVRPQAAGMPRASQRSMHPPPQFPRSSHVAAASLVWLCSCATIEREADRELGDRFDEHEPSPWTSAKACNEMSTARGPASSRLPRIGTWNIVYFPDADEEQQDDEDGTDIDWLSCALSNLDVDILAIQEFKLTKRSQEKQAELIAQLNQRTGGDWAIELAGCAPAEVQHPGFLYDKSRVSGAHFREIPILNPYEECSNRVSPGFAAYFSIAGGPDFHMVSVHMEAYPEERSLEGRAQSVSVMDQVAQEAFALVPDTDVIFAGDFNTTGCDDCSSKLSSEEEIERLRGTLVTLDPPLTLVDADLACSNAAGAVLMDHFVVDASLSELPAASIAQVGGICAETSCSRLREWHEEATERVSDHCPLTLELSALDDD
jgi:endonuclease/exonuclease/phosphatase family metal-dependent hydrolase